MKINRRILGKIITEELNEVGLYHDPKTGRWSKRKTGAVKSLTRDGARRAGVDPKHVGRGVVSGKDKIAAKMGQNFGKDQCGRLKMSGDDQTPRFKCSDYKERYAEHLDGLDGLKSREDVPVDVLLSALYDDEDEILEGLEAQCAPLRAKWTQNLLRSLNSFALAADGELFPKKEEIDSGGKRAKWKNSHYRGSEIRPDSDTSEDKKKNAKRKKIRSAVGVYVEPFNRGEKALLSTNSLWEGKWNGFIAESIDEEKEVSGTQ